MCVDDFCSVGVALVLIVLSSTNSRPMALLHVSGTPLPYSGDGRHTASAQCWGA